MENTVDMLDVSCVIDGDTFVYPPLTLYHMVVSMVASLNGLDYLLKQHVFKICSEGVWYRNGWLGMLGVSRGR